MVKVLQSRRAQRGLSLGKMVMVCVVVGLVALLGMKLAPQYIEYYKILKDCKAIAGEMSAKNGATVADVKQSFQRYADIDQITGLSANDLDITKEGNDIVIGFSYQRTVPLVANISLLIDFQGSTAK